MFRRAVKTAQRGVQALHLAPHAHPTWAGTRQTNRLVLTVQQCSLTPVCPLTSFSWPGMPWGLHSGLLSLPQLWQLWALLKRYDQKLSSEHLAAINTTRITQLCPPTFTGNGETHTTGQVFAHYGHLMPINQALVTLTESSKLLGKNRFKPTSFLKYKKKGINT